MNIGAFTQAILEATSADLIGQSDPKSIERSKAYTRYYKGLKADSSGNAETFWEVPSKSEPGLMHKCYISIIPQKTTLFRIVQNNTMQPRQKHNIIATADVKCFCSCKKFQYYGMAYKLHMQGDFAGDHTNEAEGGPGGEKIEPVHNNPDGRYVLCQHLIACFKGMKMSAFKIISDAKNTKQPPAVQVAKAPAPPASSQIQAPASTGNNQQAQPPDNTKITAPAQNQQTNTEQKPEISAPNNQTAAPQEPETSKIQAPGKKSTLNVSEQELENNKALQESALDKLGEAAEQSSEIKPPENTVEDEVENEKPDTEIKAPSSVSKVPLSDIEDAAQLDMFNVEP